MPDLTNAPTEPAAGVADAAAPAPADVPAMSMETVQTFREAFQQSFEEAWVQIAQYAPSLVAMVVVLVVGYFVAIVLRRGVTAVCDAIGLPKAAERSGLADSMKQVGIRQPVSGIVGQIAFWGTICLFLSAAFNILKLPGLSEAMQGFVNYIPSILVATVVIVLGLLVAGFLRGVVATSADRVGVPYAERLANGIYYVLAFMTFFAACDQLGIEFELLRNVILIAVAGAALGVGLAFGLGGRDVMGGILAGYYTRQRLQAGDRVSVAGMEGTVREVGPVATVIETDEDGLLNRHSIPNTKMLNEAVR